MRRITIQARQLTAGDEFSLLHHDLYRGTVTETEANKSSVHVVTSETPAGYTLDLNHAVTVYRTAKR